MNESSHRGLLGMTEAFERDDRHSHTVQIFDKLMCVERNISKDLLVNAMFLDSLCTFLHLISFTSSYSYFVGATVSIHIMEFASKNMNKIVY